MEKEHFYEYARNFKSDWYQGWQGKKVWFNFPIMLENTVIGNGEKLFPKTTALLKQINCNQICGFSLLLPGGSLYKHIDPTGKEFNSMAGNMLLTNNKHSNLIVWEGGFAPQRRNKKSRQPKHVYRHKEGKMVIFDSTQFHSADNNDPDIRIILYIDFKTSENVPLYKVPSDLIFYNTNHYRIVKILEEHWDVIASEIPFFDINNLSGYTERRLEKWINSPDFDFEEYIKNIKSKWYKGCEGIDINNTWYNFPLTVNDKIIDEGEKHCPKTISLLKKLNCKQIVGYSLLLPNSKISKHKDNTGKIFNSMTGNLLLSDNKNANVYIESDIYRHQQGKMVIYDSTYYHYADNNDSNIRVILYIDFKTKI
jgi:aspartyl/asparaginyl beta-hydroxylase (cupin superfamily)